MVGDQLYINWLKTPIQTIVMAKISIQDQVASITVTLL